MNWNPVLWNSLLRVSNFAMELEWERRYGPGASRNREDSSEDCQEGGLREDGKEKKE